MNSGPLVRERTCFLFLSPPPFFWYFCFFWSVLYSGAGIRPFSFHLSFLFRSNFLLVLPPFLLPLVYSLLLQRLPFSPSFICFITGLTACNVGIQQVSVLGVSTRRKSGGWGSHVFSACSGIVLVATWDYHAAREWAFPVPGLLRWPHTVRETSPTWVTQQLPRGGGRQIFLALILSQERQLFCFIKWRVVSHYNRKQMRSWGLITQVVASDSSSSHVN